MDDGDRGMDRCHYAVFKGILIRFTPKLFFRLNETKSEDERRAKQDDKLL